MFRKSTLALAAVASLATIALASSNALAFGHAGGGARASGGALHFSGHSNAIRFNRVVTYNRVIPRLPPPVVRLPHHPHWHWSHWHNRYWIYPVVAGGVATYSSGPTCTCLTKEYTPEGAVVFKDVCTNEMAMNPPEQGQAAAATQQ